jgi:hypothetical protein
LPTPMSVPVTRIRMSGDYIGNDPGSKRR